MEYELNNTVIRTAIRQAFRSKRGDVFPITKFIYIFRPLTSPNVPWRLDSKGTLWDEVDRLFRNRRLCPFQKKGVVENDK